MLVFDMLCAFSWNKKKGLATRMHGVETSKRRNLLPKFSSIELKLTVV